MTRDPDLVTHAAGCTSVKCTNMHPQVTVKIASVRESSTSRSTARNPRTHQPPDDFVTAVPPTARSGNPLLCGDGRPRGTAVPALQSPLDERPAVARSTLIRPTRPPPSPPTPR